ncbi:MAG: hypothetical protein K6B14_11060, partial [Lachnospiraceae bacterium]|nr:hypothetical protein [Lachnospiraceae bacterium]
MFVGRTVTGGTAKYAVTSSDSTAEPVGLSYSTSIPTAMNAGDYYIWYYVEGDNYHSDSEHVRLGQPVTIAQRPATVTASAQSVEIDGTIVQDVSKATLTDAVSGHTLSGVTLTASSTSAITPSGTITPSNAVIKDASGNDVTSNYNITYTQGTLAVTSPQVYIDGITAESTNYQGGSATANFTIAKGTDPAVVTTTARLQKGSGTLDLSTLVSGSGGVVSFAFKDGSSTGGCSLSGNTLTSGDDSGTAVI